MWLHSRLLVFPFFSISYYPPSSTLPSPSSSPPQYTGFLILKKGILLWQYKEDWAEHSQPRVGEKLEWKRTISVRGFVVSLFPKTTLGKHGEVQMQSDKDQWQRNRSVWNWQAGWPGNCIISVNSATMPKKTPRFYLQNKAMSNHSSSSSSSSALVPCLHSSQSHTLPHFSPSLCHIC